MACKCSQCCETPGETYLGDFRHTEEVKEVMRRFGTKEQIKAYLIGIEKKRGFAAMQRLRKDLLVEYRKQKTL